MTVSFKTVSEEVKRFRLGICEKCEEFRSATSICKKCGCYMPAKTTFAFVACPLKKWSTATPGDSLINKIEDAVLSSWNNQ